MLSQEARGKRQEAKSKMPRYKEVKNSSKPLLFLCIFTKLFIHYIFLSLNFFRFFSAIAGNSRIAEKLS